MYTRYGHITTLSEQGVKVIMYKVESQPSTGGIRPIAARPQSYHELQLYDLQLVVGSILVASRAFVEHLRQRLWCCLRGSVLKHDVSEFPPANSCATLGTRR